MYFIFLKSIIYVNALVVDIDNRTMQFQLKYILYRNTERIYMFNLNSTHQKNQWDTMKMLTTPF